MVDVSCTETGRREMQLQLNLIMGIVPTVILSLQPMVSSPSFFPSWLDATSRTL